MNTSERSSHPSRQQIEALLLYLERNPSLAKGFSKVASARDAARKHWEKLAIQLNSMGGSDKTWKQWTKYWADKKSAVKKKAALRAAAQCKAGSGVEVVEISEVEERIISLMGGFAMSDRHFAIDPLSEPHKNEGLPSFSSELSRLGEIATDNKKNTIADTNTSSGTDNPLTDTNTSSGTDMSTQFLPAMTSLRTPSALVEHPNVHTRKGVHSISASPTQHQQYRDSPSPSQPPLHTNSRRRIRALISSSLPSQRRYQSTSTFDRFLRLEEQRLRLEERRLQLDRRNTDILEVVTSTFQSQNVAIAQALNSIAETLKTLSDRR